MNIIILDNENSLNKIDNIKNISNYKIFYLHPVNDIKRSFYYFIVTDYYNQFNKFEN